MIVFVNKGTGGMMHRIAAFAAALLFLLAGAVHAAPPSKGEMFAKAAEGAMICAQAMPDSKATDAALKDAGFKLYDANGEAKAYFALQKRVAVIITTSSNRFDGCFVMFSKMSTDDAAQLVQPWLKLSQAQPANAGGHFVQRWTGRFKGGNIALGIYKNFRVDEIRGAAIVARSAP